MARHSRNSGTSSRLAFLDQEIVLDEEHAPFPKDIDSNICVCEWSESGYFYGMGRSIKLGPR